jgi:phosphopantothenate-cysteine ligase
MKILITSGGTKVPIDMVRSITNMSRGTFGSALCKEFILRGNEVDFLMAEGSRTPFKFEATWQGGTTFGEPAFIMNSFDEWKEFVQKHSHQYKSYAYKTFEEYYATIMTLLSKNSYDMILLAAAVSDYGVDNYVDGKVRSSESLNIELSPYPKIIGMVRPLQRNAFLVGFKLLVNSKEADLEAAAYDSLVKNDCNLVIANDLAHIRNANHTVLLVTKGETLRLEKFDCESRETTLPREVVNTIMLKYINPK